MSTIYLLPHTQDSADYDSLLHDLATSHPDLTVILVDYELRLGDTPQKIRSRLFQKYPGLRGSRVVAHGYGGNIAGVLGKQGRFTSLVLVDAVDIGPYLHQSRVSLFEYAAMRYDLFKNESLSARLQGLKYIAYHSDTDGYVLAPGVWRCRPEMPLRVDVFTGI